MTRSQPTSRDGGNDHGFEAGRTSRLGSIARWMVAIALVIGVHGAAAWVLFGQRPDAAPQGAEAAPILIDMAPPAASREVAALENAQPAEELVEEPEPAPKPEEAPPEPAPEAEAEAPPPEPTDEAVEVPEPQEVEPVPEPEVSEPEPEPQEVEPDPIADPPTVEPKPAEPVAEEPPPEDSPEPSEDAVSVPVPTFRPPTPPAVRQAIREREERQERAERRAQREQAERRERQERAERERRRERQQARRSPAPSTASQGQRQSQASQGRQVSRAAQSRWQNAVQARLNRAKRTPAGGGSGTVTIAFSVDARGRVTAARVARSGGRILDRAAIALVRRASPLPPPPGGRGVSLTVPVRFQ